MGSVACCIQQAVFRSPEHNMSHALTKYPCVCGSGEAGTETQVLLSVMPTLVWNNSAGLIVTRLSTLYGPHFPMDCVLMSVQLVTHGATVP